jgi:hypothetical protein
MAFTDTLLSPRQAEGFGMLLAEALLLGGAEPCDRMVGQS